MRKSRIVTAACLTFAMVLIAGLGRVYGVDKEDKKIPSEKEIKEMMAKTHKGDKSPLADLIQQLQSDNPEWTLVGQDVKVLSDMADMLRAARLRSRLDPDAYVASASALDNAARAKDHKAATAALTGLRQSCSKCHNYGGVGEIPK